MQQRGTGSSGSDVAYANGLIRVSLAAYTVQTILLELCLSVTRDWVNAWREV